MFKTVAFLSYNAIPGLEEGWHENQKMGTKMLVLPNSHNEKFMKEYSGNEENTAVKDQLIFLWKKLHKTIKDFDQKTIKDVDQIVFYVGAFGYKIAVRLAKKFPANKITYVACECALIEVKKLIKEVGHGESTLIVSEHHGIKTMPRLCKKFLKTGEIKN